MKMTIYLGKEENKEKIDFTINKRVKKITATTYYDTGKKYAKWECEGYPKEISTEDLKRFWIDCNIYKIKQY